MRMPEKLQNGRCWTFRRRATPGQIARGHFATGTERPTDSDRQLSNMSHENEASLRVRTIYGPSTSKVSTERFWIALEKNVAFARVVK